MGSWGPGLYDDDEASDLKDTISLLTKMPLSGDAIVDLLQKREIEGMISFEVNSSMFWLVLADQFEKKGISSPVAFKRAKDIIVNDIDIKEKIALGLSDKLVVKRKNELEKLRLRIATPRAGSGKEKKKQAPIQIVEAGQIYTFPTMEGVAFNPWMKNWEIGGFVPDGNGALLILSIGSVFDWFQWCTYAPLSVDPSKEVTLDDAKKSKLLFKDGAVYCVPDKNLMKKMEMRLLGKIFIDAEKANLAANPSRSALAAVMSESNFSNGAFSSRTNNAGFVEVSALIATDRGT